MSNETKIEINRHVVFDNGKLDGGLLAFHLYDTYGFPFDLTQQILREHDIEIDENDFEKYLREQKERSKKDRQTNNVSIAKNDEIWKELAEKLVKKHFKTEELYYQGTTECIAKIVAIVKDGKIVDKLGQDEEGVLVLDRTTFYPCGGGEVSDKGVITLLPMAKKQLKTKHKNELALLSNNVSSFVKDVAKYKGNVIGHLILAKEMLKVGDEVCCFSFRKNIGNNHTAIHLLQSALRIVLGDTVQQKGSQVSEENLRFDFSSNRAITSDEKNEIEEIINDWIDKCLQVSSVEMPKSEAEKLEALAFFGDKYGEKVRVVRIFGQDGMAISTEFCCGIHAKNTGEIGDFVIESEKSIGSGVRRITAYTGDIAKQYKKNICPANNEISRLKEDLKEKDKTWESNCEKFLQSVKIDTVMINSKRNDNMKSGENNLAMLTIAVICGDFSSVFANFIRKKLGNQYDAIFTCGIDDKFVKVTNNYNNDAKNDAIKDNNDIIDNNDYYECVFSGKSAGNFNCAVAMQKVVALLLETAINITSNGDQNKKNYARMQYKMPRNKKEKINWKGIISHIFLD